MLLTLSILAGPGIVNARADIPDDPSLFQLGIWAHDARTSNCVEVPPGGNFTIHAWGWVPDDLGLGYITFRLDFPVNVSLVGAPELPREVSDLIVTDFADGTQEWNLLVTGCPSGWVKVFSQECQAVDDQPATIDIVEDPCWMRDCTFVLNTVRVLGGVGIYDPGCGGVAVEATRWGSAKTVYR